MAYDFDSSSDKIEVADNAALDMTTAVSVAAWVHADVLGGGATPTILKKDGNYILRFDGNDIRFYYWDNTNIRYVAASNSGLDGEDHHIIGVATGNDASEIYVDGVAVGGSPVSLAGAARNLGNVLTIGAQSSGGENLDGRLAEVAIWSIGLTSTDAANLAAGMNPQLIQPANLVTYWRMKDNAKDYGPNGLDGTVTGATVDTANHPVMVPTPIIEPVSAGVFHTPTSFAVDDNNHPVNMPATTALGDGLVCLFANDGSATVTTPDGWEQLFSNANGSAARLGGYVRKADGTEGGTTVDFVTSANEKAAAQVYRILAGTWRDSGTLLNDVEEGTAATGSDANPNPPSLTASWGAEHNLWLAAYGADDDDDASAFPTGFRDGAYTESDASTTAASVGSAFRYEVIDTLNPGTFTIAATEEWIAQSIVVRPAAAAGTTAVKDMISGYIPFAR